MNTIKSIVVLALIISNVVLGQENQHDYENLRY